MEWPVITGAKRGMILAGYVLAVLLLLGTAIKSMAFHFRPTSIIEHAQR
jgi:hypothetical protein